MNDKIGTMLDPGEGEIILSGIVGSTAHGLTQVGSDVDRLGIFQRPTRQLLGLRSRRDSVVSTSPDITVHELGKFIGLALRCNPTVTELLWLDSHEIAAPVGRQLVAARSAFLSEKLVRNSYIGYANAQFLKLKARGYESFQAGIGSRSAKHARHMFRLLEQGEHLLRTGSLTTRVAEPNWYLQTLPRFTIFELTDLFNIRAAAVRDTASVLSKEPDRGRIETLLIEARISALQ